MAWVGVSVGLEKRHSQRYILPATVTHSQLYPQHRHPHIQEIIHLAIYLFFLILELTRVCMVNVHLMATLLKKKCRIIKGKRVYESATKQTLLRLLYYPKYSFINSFFGHSEKPSNLFRSLEHLKYPS